MSSAHKITANRLDTDQARQNLFDTLMVFLKEFFEKVDFEKKSANDKEACKIFPGGKELTCCLCVLVASSVDISHYAMVIVDGSTSNFSRFNLETKAKQEKSGYFTINVNASLVSKERIYP